ncbi:hypothetical protein NM688_g933 [Phlebia brevispora]|uniref:Uncharacterized protein n=1 Tax=Phlebia brevispora TaxID=194682 RepID=A0ACC1TD47_9APHY|nr:hypothetical protein NM688_g933 [Phlebia brevispora]
MKPSGKLTDPLHSVELCHFDCKRSKYLRVLASASSPTCKAWESWRLVATRASSEIRAGFSRWTKGDLIAFGRPFIGNVRRPRLPLRSTFSSSADERVLVQPDLVRRLRKNIPLTVADKSTYYAIQDPHGYIDFPFADDKDKDEKLPN